MPHHYRWLLLPLAVLLLGGCAVVYAPTVPSTPLLQQGQVQVAGGLRNLNSLEATAAWAPARHLLLSAESALSTASGSAGSSHGQLSLGAGYYHASAAPSRGYVAVLAGAGLASATVNDPTVNLSLGLGLTSGTVTYQASYWRYFVQAYLAGSVSEKSTLGFSLRTVYVDYTRLTYNDQPFAPVSHWFAEPSVFLKAGTGPVQVQGTAGFSVPFSVGENKRPGSSTTPVSSLLGVAVILRPDLLKKKE